MDYSQVFSLLPGLVESSTVMTDSSSLVSCWCRLQAWQRENEEKGKGERKRKKLCCDQAE